MQKLLLICLLFVTISACAPQQQISERRLIEWGWDTPSLQEMPAYLSQIQQLPFDGAIIDIETPLDERGLSWLVFGNDPVDSSTLQQLGQDYGDLSWGRFTDNFLRLTVHPANVDWFDDWQIIHSNAQAWSQMANDLGFVGIMLDVEQYSDANLFEYPVQQYAQNRSFNDYAQQAYLRGSEYMDALERGYPGLTVMFTYALSVERSGENEHYGLLVPFIEGMVNAADAETVLVDGFEHSYIYNQQAQFEQAREHILNIPPRYTPALNHPMRVGFGLWIDPVCGEGGLPAEGCGFSPQDFRAALTSALNASDRYVWIYSERIDWYTGERIPPVWKEMMAEFR